MATNNNYSSSKCSFQFQMPLHYPRYKKKDYEQMPEAMLDRLLNQYGLTSVTGDVHQKRSFAMSAFLWPSSQTDDNGNHRQKTTISNKCDDQDNMKKKWCSGFQIPVHYPRYKKKDYEEMSESTLDCLFGQYGLTSVTGDVYQKRRFAIGVFLWPSQTHTDSI